MKDLKIFASYSLFALCIVGVCIWGITQDYKYGGNHYEEEIEDIEEVNQENDDWEDFTKALIWVESKGDSKAVGSNNDVGVLEITPILLRDCNRILEMEIFKLEDRLDSLKSVEIFNIIQDHYNPQHDYHWALKLWNSGAPLSYHRKVMDRFNQIKNEAL